MPRPNRFLDEHTRSATRPAKRPTVERLIAAATGTRKFPIRGMQPGGGPKVGPKVGPKGLGKRPLLFKPTFYVGEGADTNKMLRKMRAQLDYALRLQDRAGVGSADGRGLDVGPEEILALGRGLLYWPSDGQKQDWQADSQALEQKFSAGQDASWNGMEDGTQLKAVDSTADTPDAVPGIGGTDTTFGPVAQPDTDKPIQPKSWEEIQLEAWALGMAPEEYLHQLRDENEKKALAVPGATQIQQLPQEIKEKTLWDLILDGADAQIQRGRELWNAPSFDSFMNWWTYGGYHAGGDRWRRLMEAGTPYQVVRELENVLTGGMVDDTQMLLSGELTLSEGILVTGSLLSKPVAYAGTYRTMSNIYSQSFIHMPTPEDLIAWSERYGALTFGDSLPEGTVPDGSRDVSFNEGAGSSVSKLPKTTAESVNIKLETYLLEPTHPDGGSKAKWFEQALGFNKNNANALAEQITFNPKTAVQTATTEFGTKFSLTIPIKGVSGRVIDVEFIWIHNKDGVVRLVTAIPTKK